MIVGIQTFERIFIFETFVTKEKIVTILTHVAVFNYLDFAGKTFVFFVIINLGLEDNFHLMIRLVIS